MFNAKQECQMFAQPRLEPTKSDLSKEIQSYLPRFLGTLNLPFVPHESTDGTAIRHDAQLQGTLPSFRQNLRLKNAQKCTLDSATRVDVM